MAGAGLRSYRFGMAVDPDLGGTAADDVAGYEAGRGLVLVADAGEVMGFLLRRGGENALASVQEYGVRRWAPATGEAVWAAQRSAGAQVIGTPRDVQLLLSAPEAAGNATWTFLVVRGPSAAAVRASADAAVRALR